VKLYSVLVLVLLGCAHPPPVRPADVTQVSSSAYTVEQALLDSYLLNPFSLSDEIRIVTARDKKKNIVGYRFKKIKPGTLFDKLGFCVGDVVYEVNGLALDGPKHAMEAYVSLQEARRFEVRLWRRRKGKRKTIIMSYQVRNAKG